jgi:hypothetical protein
MGTVIRLMNIDETCSSDQQSLLKTQLLDGLATPSLQVHLGPFEWPTAKQTTVSHHFQEHELHG